MGYYFQSSNPCICTPSSTPGTPDCPSECVCLELCNITINPLDNPVAVGPCAATGTLDVTDASFGHDFCACGTNPVYWTLEYYDKDLLTSASVTSGGMLTWITGDVSTVGKFPCIILKACCGLLSAYLFIYIGIKDLCDCPGCEPCEICDECSGECLDEVETSIAINDMSGDSSISS